MSAVNVCYMNPDKVDTGELLAFAKALVRMDGREPKHLGTYALILVLYLAHYRYPCQVHCKTL